MHVKSATNLNRRDSRAMVLASTNLQELTVAQTGETEEDFTYLFEQIEQI